MVNYRDIVWAIMGLIVYLRVSQRGRYYPLGSIFEICRVYFYLVVKLLLSTYY